MPAVFIFIAIVYFLFFSDSFFSSLIEFIGGCFIIISCIIGVICPPIGGIMALIAFILGKILGFWH